MITKEFGLNDIRSIVASDILPLMKIYRIFTFTGPLGAGKTTIIKEILRQCGITQIIVSPTFTYVQQYMNDKNHVFNHFDLYRLASSDSFFEFGFDEYLYDTSSTIFIEWPEVLEDILMEKSICGDVCRIKLRYKSKDITSRILQIN